MIVLGKNIKLQSGFTIAELMVAVTIGSIISVLMLSVFMYGYGGLLVEQSRASMVLESQLFLRKVTEDIRVANQILSTNTITDLYEPVGGWLTSDPANILIMTQPAIDQNDDFITDSNTGYPYQNEVIYFGDNKDMYRRTLKNTNATGNIATTTCPAGIANCLSDISLSENLKNMTFVFRDIDDIVTTIISEARSVEVTVNLEKVIFGRTLSVQNTTRMTLRNES